MSYETYTNDNEQRMYAAYIIGKFDEEMDYDQFCLECYADYMANTVAD